MALYPMRKFVAPEFIFGVGARHRVGFYARNMRARKVLIVSDDGVIAAGWLKDIEESLARVGIASVLFKELTPNPKDFEVMAGAELYAREKCDVIVALGGGSVMDCAKAIGIVFANQEEISAFEGADKVEVLSPLSSASPPQPAQPRRFPSSASSSTRPSTTRWPSSARVWCRISPWWIRKPP